MAVLEHNDELNVKYFNSKGLEFLKEAALLTSESDEQIKSLQNIKSQIDAYSKVEVLDTNILFKSPILKLYCDQSNQTGTQDPIDPKTKFEINKKFCLGDLEKISDQDLETKVFVAGSCPDNLNLDDDLVLNTKFLRVKK